MLNVNRTAAPNMHTLSLFGQQDKNNITAARTAALAGLPLYLKEDSSEVFKTCKVFLYSPFSVFIA